MQTQKSSRIYEPVGSRVLVLPDPEVDITKGGIIIPEKSQERPQSGKVVAVGPGAMTVAGTREVVQAKVGDNVIYAKYAGTNIDIDGTVHLIISDHELLMIVREKGGK